MITCSVKKLEIDHAPELGMSGLIVAERPVEIWLFQTQSPTGGIEFEAPVTGPVVLIQNKSIRDTLTQLDSLRFLSNLRPVATDEIQIEVYDNGSSVLQSEVIIVPGALQFDNIIRLVEDDSPARAYDLITADLRTDLDHGDCILMKVRETRKSISKVLYRTNQFEWSPTSYCFETGFSISKYRIYNVECKSNPFPIVMQSVGGDGFRFRDSIEIILCATDVFSSDFFETTEIAGGDIPAANLLFNFDGTFPSNISTGNGAVLTMYCDTIEAF